MAIKNMASKTSKITEKVKNHGNFIVEQVHANRENMLNSTKCVLVIKDLDKLIVDLKNKPKDKQFDCARTETKKFLLARGIKNENIVKIYSYSERLSSIRVVFRDELERNEADIKVRNDFGNNKIRTMRLQYDDFPGNSKIDLDVIRENLRLKYNLKVEQEYQVNKPTWNNFIRLTIINAGSKNGKKNYIEFTDPTCPNYNVLVFNHEAEGGQHDPYFGFEWNEVIPNPKLRQHFDKDFGKLSYYAFKTYGVHTRRSHTVATWKKVETDWLTVGEEPPQVTTRRNGATSRNAQ